MVMDHTNPDSLARQRSSVERQLSRLRFTLAENRLAGVTVRLVANEDGEIWYATGDVQYDTVHGAACEAVVLRADSDLAARLVDGVAAQLGELSEVR